MSERSWVGSGKGRNPGQPSLELNGGPGMGGGRASQGGYNDMKAEAGKGSGRPGSQPSIDEPTDFGESSKKYSSTPDAAGGSYRGASSHAAATTGGSKDPRTADPEGNFVFALEIGGTEVGYFMECSGLKTTTEPFEIQEGGMNHRVHKVPGQSKWENIVLRYGVTADTTMLTWRNEILQDSFSFGKRRNGAIVMKTMGGDEVRRYNFIEGWPVSWEGPSLASAGYEIAVESLEIAHNGIQIT